MFIVCTVVSFNSRPHEEVDGGTSWGQFLRKMFQLTTSRRGRQDHQKVLYGGLGCFNSRPHEEVDFAVAGAIGDTGGFQLTTSRRGRLARLIYKWQMMVFQLTTSRRGRRMSRSESRYRFDVSTHDLTKRSTPWT